MEQKHESRQLLVNGRIYTPDGFVEQGRMLISQSGTIDAVGGAELQVDDAQVLDIQGKQVLPGFIDIHVHGGNGHHMMNGTLASLEGMSRFHCAHGTTSFLATTEADSEAAILHALRHTAQAVGKDLGGAEMLGVHLEGPFLNTVRAGAQNKSHIRVADLEELGRYMTASENGVRLVTLAPEIEHGFEALDMLVRLGITVSIGHSDASYSQVLEAVQRGATHTTHHFNGMSPLHHREPGVAGSGLIFPELTTELIADGIHVHPAIVKLLFDVKGPRGVCLITDAVYNAGLPDGIYGNTIMKDGQIRLLDGSSLAGSSLTMLAALKNALAFTGYSLDQIVPSLTEVPARQIGVLPSKGTLEAGKDADFLILDDELRLHATYVRGGKVYSSVLHCSSDGLA